MKEISIKFVTILAYVFATVIILSAAAVSTARLMTPYFNAHLPDFESWASLELHTPISIGDARITWNIYEPELSFSKVAFLDEKTKQPKIELQHLTVNFYILKSILHRKVLVENVRAIGAALTIHQKTATQFTLDGFAGVEVTDNFTGSSMEGNKLAGFLCSVPDIYLENIDLHIVPTNEKEYFLTIKHLEFANNDAKHTLDGRVILHQEFETTATVHVRLQGAIDDLSHASAQFYVYLEGVDLLQWLKDKTWKNLQVMQGVGSIKLWGEWNQNALQKMQTTFQFYSLEIKSQLSKKTIEIPRISGNIGWQNNGKNQTLAGDQIFIDFDDHLWPTDSFSVTWSEDKDGAFQPEEIVARYLDLADVQRIALNSGLLSNEMQKKVSAFSPRGEIKNFHFKDSTLTTDFLNLGAEAFQEYPGFSHLSGRVDWNRDAGNLYLSSNNLSVHLPSVFANDLMFDQVTGIVAFQKSATNDWNVKTKDLTLKNADLNAYPEITFILPEKGPANIKLSADFNMINAAHISDYLPLKTFDADLQAWLRKAFLSGQVDSGKAVLEGNLVDFPFDNHNGKFEIMGSVSKVNFLFAPHWPLLKNLDGTLDFKGRSMVVMVTSGQLADISIGKVTAVIPVMGTKAPEILSINSDTIQSDFVSGMRFIHESPLEETIGKQFSKVNLSGPLQLNLHLDIPLQKTDDTKVAGHIVMTDTSILLPLWKLTLSKLQGVVDFTESSVTAKNISGIFFNSPMTLDVATDSTIKNAAHVVATLKTKIDVTTLEKWLELPLAQYAKGETAMTTTVHIYPAEKSAHPTEVNIQSNLQGLALQLPLGYGKKAEESRALQLNFVASEDQLKAKINYANLKLGVGKNEHNWLVDIDSQDVVGKVSIPRDNTSSRIQANFSRVYLNSGETVKANGIDPEKIPPLSFTADVVHFGSKNLGRVILNTDSVSHGLLVTALEMNTGSVTLKATGSWHQQNGKNTSHLQGDLDTLTLNDALRDWGYPSSSLVGSKANVNFDLNWPDALYAPSAKGMTGDVTFLFAKGRIVNLSQSSNAQMDVGRLLNLFNLSTIPRRLSGDFSDVTQKGYSFDSIKGHFSLKDGNAYTQNTRLDGPIAGISLSGRIGLVAKDFDLRMAVTPYVTSGLPFVAAAAAPLTGGASLVVGAATWAADKLFVGKEVSKVITHNYAITGTWDNPAWKQVGAAGT